MPFVYNLNIRNVNAALPRGLQLLMASGMREGSRNGDVAVMPAPVTTIYERPMERVLFSSVRDANPFFHLFESLWMLAGRQELDWLAQFNKQMRSYSDDGATQPAAYGHRWRKYFGQDQIPLVVAELTKNPGSRRAVLAMWDGGNPLDGGDMDRVLAGTADAPCNTHCYFRIVNGALDMAVMCRSNDILWGAYGANAVHFSVLQEYVATLLQLPVGTMYQFSFNYHVYLDVLGGPERAVAMTKDAEATNLYDKGMRTTQVVWGDVTQFDADLELFMAHADPALPIVPPNGYATPFFTETAAPMLEAWWAHKAGDYGSALAAAGRIVGPDWQAACLAWLQRRAKNRMEKQNG